jgi:hypothetical protein
LILIHFLFTNFFSPFLIVFVIYFANQISQQVFMAPKKWNADHTHFPRVVFYLYFRFSFMRFWGQCAWFPRVWSTAYPGVARTSDRKGGVFRLVVDIVFEGIEELKREFGQPSD